MTDKNESTTNSSTAPAASQTQRSQLKNLIARGKEQGYLTYAEINDHLPPEAIDSETY